MPMMAQALDPTLNQECMIITPAKFLRAAQALEQVRQKCKLKGKRVL